MVGQGLAIVLGRFFIRRICELGFSELGLGVFPSVPMNSWKIFFPDESPPSKLYPMMTLKVDGKIWKISYFVDPYLSNSNQISANLY